ncbi:MAG: hypothetical protein JW384_00964 [Nitrosomonadaceae bacterium]|nr:hypothetical protein [Nitrosomonadaceae bacterium]
MVTAACGGARVVSACAPHGLSYGHAAGRDSHLTWDRVDLEKSRIFLPGHLTKTGQERLVPLTLPLPQEFQRLRG